MAAPSLPSSAIPPCQTMLGGGREHTKYESLTKFQGVSLHYHFNSVHSAYFTVNSTYSPIYDNIFTANHCFYIPKTSKNQSEQQNHCCFPCGFFFFLSHCSIHKYQSKREVGGASILTFCLSQRQMFVYLDGILTKSIIF